MSYLILGIGLLAGLLLAGKWFVSAEPKTLARVLKWVLFGVVGIVALFFILSGRFIWVLWMLPVLLPWIMRLRAVARTAKNYSRMSSGGGSGQGSTVMSEYLEMHLDHDSGDMDGIIRKSTHEGARLSDLSAEQLAALYDEYAQYTGRRGAERAKNCNLGAFFPHDHHQCRHNIKGRNRNNQQQDDKDD